LPICVRAAATGSQRKWAEQGRADLALLRGQPDAYQRLIAQLRRERDPAELGLDDQIDAALIDVVIRGHANRALARIDSTLAQVPLRTVPVTLRDYEKLATIYARTGHPDRAREVVQQYYADVRDSTRVKAKRPSIDAALGEIALAEGKPLEAIASFRRADMADDGPASACALPLFVHLAEAFDRASEPDSAIALYERYVSTPCSERASWPMDPIQLPVAYERLSQLYATKADTTRALKYLQNFVELWKDAEPALKPRVAQARARMTALKSHATAIGSPR